MDARTKALKNTLRRAGISDPAVNAAWPGWWSEAAADSPSAQAELRFAVARKLGVSASALAQDEVEFVWRDQARFKHLGAETALEQAALASFGSALANHVAAAVRSLPVMGVPSAQDLREAILASRPMVDLAGLLSTCWAIGVPVLHLRVFPLAAKLMHAMVVRSGDRQIILLAKDAHYPAHVAFTLAHELGHLSLGHLEQSSAIIDLEDPASGSDRDFEERSADEFALELLTGSTSPDIEAQILNPSGRALAAAVQSAGPPRGIEPGTLALCFAYQTGNWAGAQAAMRHIYDRPRDVWAEVNGVAETQVDWSSLSNDSDQFLRKVMGLGE